jgi:hypothetical protein
LAAYSPAARLVRRLPIRRLRRPPRLAGCPGLRTCASQPTLAYDAPPAAVTSVTSAPAAPSGPRTLLFTETLRAYSAQSLRDHEIPSARYPMRVSCGGSQAKHSLNTSSAILCIFLGYPHSAHAVRRVTKTRSYKRIVAEHPRCAAPGAARKKARAKTIRMNRARPAPG